MVGEDVDDVGPEDPEGISAEENDGMCASRILPAVPPGNQVGRCGIWEDFYYEFERDTQWQ